MFTPMINSLIATSPLSSQSPTHPPPGPPVGVGVGPVASPATQKVRSISLMVSQRLDGVHSSKSSQALPMLAGWHAPVSALQVSQVGSHLTALPSHSPVSTSQASLHRLPSVSGHSLNSGKQRAWFSGG